jgi:hypothetical protein
MNRLSHIKETFIRNLLDNINYPRLEFNLLDYNSTDGLHAWAQKELQQYINNGIVNYYRTDEPAYFHRSHSRNMIFKLSTGDIVCNVDADNFCGAGFAHYINKVMSENENYEKSFLIPARELREESDRNAYGRIAVRRSDFISVKGFDERMDGYGFEDTDFINRLQKLGKTPVLIDEPNFLKGISHPQSLRISEEKYYKTISNIFIAQIAPYASKVLFLFKDHVFHYATLIDHEVMSSLRFQYKQLSTRYSKYKYPIEFEDHKMYSGIWHEHNNTISLGFNSRNKKLCLQYKPQSDTYEDEKGKGSFFIVKNDYLKENLIYLFPQIQNRNYMDQNVTSGIPVNKQGFGKGRVYRNLETRPVQLA